MEEQGIHSLLLRRPGGPGSGGSASEEMLIAWGEGGSPRLWEQLPIPAQRTHPGVGRAELGLRSGSVHGAVLGSARDLQGRGNVQVSLFA